jgi:signal transduction histidine kinase
MNSKMQTADWVRRYHKALHLYLSQGKLACLTSARRLGSQAATSGMTTLEIAQIHKEVFNAILSCKTLKQSYKRACVQAKLFFNETNSLIEKTHVATQTQEGRVQRLAKVLLKRTAESKASRKRLQTGIVYRKKAEAALEKSSKEHAKLIIISKRLRNLLRSQTHAIFANQEKERKKTSQGLQDRIAQALLGLDIELLALKVSDKERTLRFSKEIDSLKECVRLKPTLHNGRS